MTTEVMLSTENQVALNHDIEIYKGASMLTITTEEQSKLNAEFERSLIEIRPDGMIYLPQVFWRGRLNATFGIGQWCLIPKGQVKDPAKNKLYIEGVLMIRGHYVSTAVGEAEYRESNANQSWASVWESAKSDCITRCCKDLGIASELWQPEFIRKWVADYAIQVFIYPDKNDRSKVKPAWRKKTAEPFWNEKRQGDHPPSNQQQPKAQPAPQTDHGNTAYNHQSMNQNGKPQISNENFKKLCDRLKGGEIGVYDQAINHFSLDQAQQKTFKAIKELVENQLTETPETESLNRVVAVWSAKVDKCHTIDALTELYNKNRLTIEANQVITHLFTARKLELQKK